jgi:hypothetical protein
MLRDMRPSELGLWLALWETDPWGEQRADLRQAMTSRAVSQTALKRIGGGEWALTDFMPYLEKTEPTDKDRLRQQFARRIERKD